MPGLAGRVGWLVGVGLTVLLAVGSPVLASRLCIPALIVFTPSGQHVDRTRDDEPEHQEGGRRL